MNTLSGPRGSVVDYRGVEVMQSGDHDDTPFHSSGTMDPVQGATKRSTPLNNISEVSKPPEAHTTQPEVSFFRPPAEWEPLTGNKGNFTEAYL